MIIPLIGSYNGYLPGLKQKLLFCPDCGAQPAIAGLAIFAQPLEKV